MSELPMRLREVADGSTRPIPVELLREAADRIEYLESVAGAVSQPTAADYEAYVKRHRREEAERWLKGEVEKKRQRDA